MIAADITEARALAVQTLTDTVELTRDGEAAYDELGTLTRATATVHTGPGLVQLEQSSARTVVVTAANQQVDAQGYVCKLPIDVDVRAGDVVRVTASLDPRQVGRRWRVTAVPTQAWSVLRRCTVDPIEEVTP